MAVGDVYRAEIFQNVGSEVTMNVLHFREVVAETVALLLAEPVAAAGHAIYDAVKDFMSEDWQVIQITARRIQPTPTVPFTRVLGAADSIVGGVVSEIIPSASALLVSLYSSNASKRGRGRLYLPGIPENAQNEGQITEAAHTNFDTWADTWLTEQIGPFGVGNTGEYRVYIQSSFILASDPDQDVIATTVRPNLATQRRRRAHPGFSA